MKNKKKVVSGRGVGGGGGDQVGGGGQCGCGQRIEVFVKIKKKSRGFGSWESGWGIRVGVKEELKFL